MKRMTLWASLALMGLGAGCTTVGTSGEALCEGTARLRTDHAAALVEAPDRAVVTGARLIAAIDAGCR